MSGKKISELPILSNPSLTGVTAIVEGDVTYQSSLSSLKSLLVNTEISVTGGSISGDTIYINNSDGNTIPITGLSNTFIYNQTRIGVSNIVKSHESLFNHSDLVVQPNTIFIVESNGEYYVLGDLYNDGMMIIDGTLKIGGVLYNTGSILGSGTII